jgi:hypothetical protein
LRLARGVDIFHKRARNSRWACGDIQEDFTAKNAAEEELYFGKEEQLYFHGSNVSV